MDWSFESSNGISGGILLLRTNHLVHCNVVIVVCNLYPHSIPFPNNCFGVEFTLRFNEDFLAFSALSARQLSQYILENISLVYELEGNKDKISSLVAGILERQRGH